MFWLRISGFPVPQSGAKPIHQPTDKKTAHRLDANVAGNESRTEQPKGQQMFAVIKTGGKQYRVAAND
ncbi:50S ribosomal protein L21, partial [Brucella abortus]